MKSLCIFLACASLAVANDTAVNAGGHAPQPLGEFKGDESVIRMVSEKIDITFGKNESKVHCRFVFRSTKKEGDAKQKLGFPDFILDGGDQGSITAMKTLVDGKEVAAKKELGWFTDNDMPRAGLGEMPQPGLQHAKVEYHTVDVVFPAGRDVIVERIYTVSNGGSVEGNTTFSYTTFTGAIWQGSIGRAEFNLTLDGWKIDDLAFEDGPQKRDPRQQAVFCSPNKQAWTIESPTKLKMVWENFEPAVHQTRRGISLTTWAIDRTKEENQ